MDGNVERTAKGFFITIRDEASLHLCLDRGVYGQYMQPEHGHPSSYHHFRVLADFACARGGDHVFFFHKRRIYYGGQINGTSDTGAFVLNGPYSPLGRAADAPVGWDESTREDRDSCDAPGVFRIATRDGEKRVCQPYLLDFDDHVDLQGTHVSSDALYFRLGKHAHPVPSNTIEGMGFCTISPGETQQLLDLYHNQADGALELTPPETTQTQALPAYHSRYDTHELSDTQSEAHLESTILANPSHLPDRFQPSSTAAIGRQIPMSPHRPNVDRVDIAYYASSTVLDGTFPSHIIELKHSRAGKQAALQVKQYHQWLGRVLEDPCETVTLSILAPSFTSTFDSYLDSAQLSLLQKHSFDDDAGPPN